MSMAIKPDFASAPLKKNNITVPSDLKNAPNSLTNKKNADEVTEPVHVQNKKRLNAAILDSALKFNTTIKNQPESLLLKTILQGINKALQEIDIEKTVEDNYEEGIDVSPQATAERIVMFSTQYYGVYQQRHPEMDEEQSLTSYIDIISGAIDQGFLEAKEILTNLNALEGDTGKNIEKTYVLVQQLLQIFLDNKRAEMPVGDKNIISKEDNIKDKEVSK
ncbi:hypothetical protein PCNPT3_11025 [Psychromonas sp. CNPT3]|uniref:DUF5610 domain-containing protein n=1 Tax=Psychromonas sp. CNPT3 TaxID=314282 RepID=UPI00006E4265|nr:DUF5610 domain-containing protein [Psychromonas sp. CNPT3]AGH82141.1 hypothetical protein PCNPT3_11025 [Psychromonas sp. CNPT3]